MIEVRPSEFTEATGRDVAAILDPCPVCIIGARLVEVEAEIGANIGFATIIWAMPISHSPAMVAFALRAKSHTMSLIQATGRFSLSTLPADEEGVRILEHCGYNTGHRIDKSEALEYELIDGLPVPSHALSWEICEVESIRETGDHLLVVGRVLQAASRGSRDDKGRLAPAETLLCIQHGAYAAAGETI